MTMEAHVQTLHQKHKHLEDAIHKESLRPSPDQARMSELKRQKLKLKDDILRYTKH